MSCTRILVSNVRYVHCRIRCTIHLLYRQKCWKSFFTIQMDIYICFSIWSFTCSRCTGDFSLTACVLRGQVVGSQWECTEFCLTGRAAEAVCFLLHVNIPSVASSLQDVSARSPKKFSRGGKNCPDICNFYLLATQYVHDKKIKGES